MKNDPYITIFTPTYNRCALLQRLYNSLRNQTCKEFEWLIVDDGSTDATESYINSLIQNSPFSIVYHRQSNGGKHRAINTGSMLASGCWFLIVDSDDCLSCDAISDYYPYLIKNEQDSIGSVSFLINDHNGFLVGDLFPENKVMARYTDMWELGCFADRADAVKVSALRDIAFPEFPGENFLSESAFWLMLAEKYQSRFYNVHGYVCQYLPGGLSSKSLENRVLCPKGAMFIYEKQYQLFTSKVLKVKAAINIWRFFLHAPDTDRAMIVPLIFASIAGLIYIRDRISLR